MIDSILHIEKDIEKQTTTSQALSKMLVMLKEDEVLKVHTYKISKLSGKDERWHTYIKDSSKKSGLKEIKKPKKSEIINFLFDHYGLSSVKFSDLYKEWIEQQKTLCSSQNTVRRHEQRYKKYLENSSISKINLLKIDKINFQLECNRIVKEYNMTSKEWINVKSILNGVFNLAIDKDIIHENPTERLKISVKFRQVKKVSAEKVFQEDEYEALVQTMNEKFNATKDPIFLAVLLQLYSGMRVGEIVALKWIDINFEKKEIKISRSEVNQPVQEHGKWRNNFIIEEHTKTYSERKIKLLPKAEEVLTKISKNNEFVFYRNGKRASERAVNYALEKFAAEKGLDIRRSHALRRTYASRLHEAKVPLRAIQLDLGHSDLETTFHYIYDSQADSTSYDLKAKAI